MIRTREIREQVADDLILMIHQCMEIRMSWEIGEPELAKSDGTVLWKPNIGIETPFRTTDTQLELIGHFSDPSDRYLHIPLIQITFKNLQLRWAPIPWQPLNDRWTRPEQDFSDWMDLQDANDMQRILIAWRTEKLK